MQIRQNSTVKTASGETVGRVSHFVIDPRSNDITHLIVEKGFLFMEDRIVPIDAVRSATQDEVMLTLEAGEPESFAVFDHTYYTRRNEPDTQPDPFPALSAYYYYPPVVGSASPVIAVPPPSSDVNAAEQLPEHTVAVRKGADIYTSDDVLIGQVHEIYLSTEHENRVTHLVMAQGLLNRTYKLIPFHWVAAMSSERVDLGTSRKVIDDLPDYQG